MRSKIRTKMRKKHRAISTSPDTDQEKAAVEKKASDYSGPQNSDQAIS